MTFTCYGQIMKFEVEIADLFSFKLGIAFCLCCYGKELSTILKLITILKLPVLTHCFLRRTHAELKHFPLR